MSITCCCQLPLLAHGGLRSITLIYNRGDNVNSCTAGHFMNASMPRPRQQSLVVTKTVRLYFFVFLYVECTIVSSPWIGIVQKHQLFIYWHCWTGYSFQSHVRKCHHWSRWDSCVVCLKTRHLYIHCCYNYSHQWAAQRWLQDLYNSNTQGRNWAPLCDVKLTVQAESAWCLQ